MPSQRLIPDPKQYRGHYHAYDGRFYVSSGYQGTSYKYAVRDNLVERTFRARTLEDVREIIRDQVREDDRVREDKPRGTTSNLILTALADTHPRPLTVTELAERTGKSKVAVSRYANAWVKDRVLLKTRKRPFRYRLAEDDDEA